MPACSEGQKQKPRKKLTRILLRLPRSKRYDRNDHRPRRKPLPKRNRLRLRSLRRKEADPQRNTRKHKESYGMTPETLDKWKILPRIMMITITFMSYRVAEWYMDLPDPTIEQSGFCSIVVGALTGSFAIWMGKEAQGK